MRIFKIFSKDELDINANLINIKKYDSLRKFAIITKTNTAKVAQARFR